MANSAQDDVLAIARERMPGWAFAVLKQRLATGPAAGPVAPKRGLMVALMLPPGAAAKLAQEGGEPAERMHCTLAYPGKVEDLAPDCIERVTRAVEKVCSEFAPFVGLIGGAGRFNASTSSDGKDVIHASLDAPVLGALQQAIARAMDDEKCPPKREHGFDPHITIRYQEKGADLELPQIPTLPVVFESIAVVAGDERIAEIPLTGTRVTKSEEIEKREWDTAYVNDLPDSAFLHIVPGGEKDDQGKTVPRSLRYFPVRNANGKIDLPHLRNALARIPQSKLPTAVRAKAQARAREMLEEASEVDKYDPDQPRDELGRFGEGGGGGGRGDAPGRGGEGETTFANTPAEVSAVARRHRGTRYEGNVFEFPTTDAAASFAEEVAYPSTREHRVVTVQMGDPGPGDVHVPGPLGDDEVDKYDPDQPRDEQGRFGEGGGGGSSRESRRRGFEQPHSAPRADEPSREERRRAITGPEPSSFMRAPGHYRDTEENRRRQARENRRRASRSAAFGKAEDIDIEQVAELLEELRERGLTIEQARARARAELRDLDVSREEATDLVHEAERVAKARPMSREYLEEAWALARKLLPAWAWAQIHQQARPRSGGLARWRRAPQIEIDKGFPNGTAENGVHVHNLERETSRTKADGLHAHLFVLPDGREVWTEEDGAHAHLLGSSMADLLTAPSGAHRHRVVVDGVEMLTEEDGDHVHQLQAWSSAFDGVHKHALKLADGTVVENMMPGEWWEWAGKPVQDGTPPAAPASELAKEVVVQSAGPMDAMIAFVSASPSPLEVARGESVVGQFGETLNELYLRPLELDRSQIVVTNVVPRLLKDEGGRPRDPTSEEIEKWRPWLAGEIERLRPKAVVALGQIAKRALGDLAHAALPHPGAVRRFGDSGEVGRKLRQIRELIGKAAPASAPKAKVEKQPEGGEETRSGQAFRAWERDWHKQLPRSGKGRFVYQHHWRGLDEEQAKGATDADLLRGDHGLHGDIRLEGEDGQLWGWAVLVGSAGENRAGDRLLKLGGTDKLRLANKLPHPKSWLDVGVGEPKIIEPGAVGATSNTWSKIFAVDHGSFDLGVARQHAIEIFLDGEHLKGRYLISLAPVGDQRVWLIDKPQDQRPAAEQSELADLIGELRRKRQRYLIWGKPGQAPQKIDVMTGKVVKSAVVPLLKERTLEDKRIVYGVVLDPYVVDAHEDWVPPNVVEETAHGWFKGSRMVTLHHKTHADAQAVESSIVEYPSRRDYVAARQGEPHKAWRRQFGDDVAHSGAWILGVQLSPELWEAYKRDEIAAFSIEGFGIRTPTTTKAMPKVSFVDLVERK